MIDAFVEGVRSISQVCHLVIVVPVALTIIAARGRWHAAAGALLGVVTGGWIFAAGWVDVTDTRLRVSAVVVAAALVMLALPNVAIRPDESQEDPAPSSTWPSLFETPAAVAACSTAIALVVTHWWRPCVGVELGKILTRTPDDPLGQIPATAGFMIGVALPLALVGLAYVAAQPAPAVASRLAVVGSGVGIVLAGSVVAGQHGEIVSRLFQWSQ